MRRMLLIAGGGAAAIVAVAAVTGACIAINVIETLRDEPHGAVYVLGIRTQQLNKIANDGASEVAWTHDGQSIWYTDAGVPNVYGTSVKSVDVASGKRRTVIDLGHAGFVSMSPAAGLAAYATGSGADLTVRVASIDGERQSFGAGIYPKLSPDGRRLLFMAPVCGNDQAVKVAETFDSGSVTSTADGNVYYAGWLDEEHIIYEKYMTQASYESGVLKHAVSAAFIQRLGEPPRPAMSFERNATISPDGRFAAYQPVLGGHVFLRDVVSEAETDLGAAAPNGAWSPDSQMFAVTVRPTEDRDYELLQVFNREGAKSFSVDVTMSRRGELVTSLDWSPDGSKLAIGVQGGGNGYPPCGT